MIVKARPNQDYFKAMLQSTHSSPISPETINDLQEEKFEKIARSENIDSLVLPSPELEDGENIVAYAQRMTSDGVPRTYTGYAYSEEYFESRLKVDSENSENITFELDGEEDVKKEEIKYDIKRKRAKQIENIDFENTVKDRHKRAEDIANGTTSYVESDDYSIDPAWELRNWDTYDSGGEPYGYLDNDVSIFWHDDEDVVASTNTLNYTPGTSQDYSDDYEMEELDVRHNWSSNSIAGDVTSIDRYPSGDYTGERNITGVSIGYISAGISFDFYQPDTERSDEFDQSLAAPQWNWQWQSDRETPNITRVGSISRFEDTDPTFVSTVMRTESTIVFRSRECPIGGPTCYWVYDALDNDHQHDLRTD